MKITNLINVNSINLNAQVKDKNDAINQLVELMSKGGNVTNKEDLKNALLEREKLSTTGIGGEIAIPHAKTNAISKTGIAIMIVKDGVDYEALDGENTKLFFMIGATDNGQDEHLKVLSRLSTLIMNTQFKEEMLKASSSNDILNIIDKFEKEKFNEDKEESTNLDYDVLCVTACPTGIAHTFMAAESLEAKALECGIKVKVETNGSSGVENALTPEEIKKAKCIIVAADKKVAMDRFNGKKVIQVKVSEGIKNPKKLLDLAMSGETPMFYASEENKAIFTESESIGRKIYKDLMNGVSNMLPLVVCGGVLIALSIALSGIKAGAGEM